MTKILMVCLGNICRSPLAEGILKSKLFGFETMIDSAGTGAYHINKKPDIRSIAIAKLNGLDITDQRARQFSVADFDNFDLIYAMDTANYKDILHLARNEADKVKKITPFYTYLFDIMEPYDSTYSEEKESQITAAMMKATQ